VADTGTGADSWTPGFPGQRPPFTAGNEAALVTGHRSERHVGPLATRIARELLDDPATPDHIRDPMFAASVRAWARAEAVCTLVWQAIAEQDITGALADITHTDETEIAKRGTTTRRSVSRRTTTLEQLRKFEAHAASLRSKLGLDPASAARVARDLAARRYMDATPLNAALQAIEERRALTAGSTDE
jgi:hypothetical protein